MHDPSEIIRKEHLHHNLKHLKIL